MSKILGRCKYCYNLNKETLFCEYSKRVLSTFEINTITVCDERNNNVLVCKYCFYTSDDGCKCVEIH